MCLRVPIAIASKALADQKARALLELQTASDVALGEQADVRGNHAPTGGRAHPCLALTTGSRTACALEFCIGRCKIFPVGGQYGMHADTVQALRWAGSPESLNGFITVQVLRGAVAQGVRTVPK